MHLQNLNKYLSIFLLWKESLFNKITSKYKCTLIDVLTKYSPKCTSTKKKTFIRMLNLVLVSRFSLQQGALNSKCHDFYSYTHCWRTSFNGIGLFQIPSAFSSVIHLCIIASKNAGNAMSSWQDGIYTWFKEGTKHTLLYFYFYFLGNCDNLLLCIDGTSLIFCLYSIDVVFGLKEKILSLRFFTVDFVVNILKLKSFHNSNIKFVYKCICIFTKS